MNSKTEISKLKSPFCYSSPVPIGSRRKLQYMQRIQPSAGAKAAGGKGAEDICPKKSKGDAGALSGGYIPQKK